jgi:hypothetical protein
MKARANQELQNICLTLLGYVSLLIHASMNAKARNRTDPNMLDPWTYPRILSGICLLRPP